MQVCVTCIQKYSEGCSLKCEWLASGFGDLGVPLLIKTYSLPYSHCSHSIIIKNKALDYLQFVNTLCGRAHGDPVMVGHRHCIWSMWLCSTATAQNHVCKDVHCRAGLEITFIFINGKVLRKLQHFLSHKRWSMLSWTLNEQRVTKSYFVFYDSNYINIKKLLEGNA